MSYSDFWLKPLQNLGFELFVAQFCEIQAYPSLERILRNQKAINQKIKKPKKSKTMFETKWGHYWFFVFLAAFCLKHWVVFCFLVYCFLFFGLLFFCFFLVYWFIGFVVFPLNWDRLGSHKIEQQIAQNLNFGEVFARNHCKTQCFGIIFCMKNISQEHPFCYFIDDHPASQWPSIFSRVWAPGAGNLCFLLPPAFLFGHNASDMRPLFVLKRNALLLKKNVSLLPNNSVTHLLPAEAKRDRLLTIWSISTSSTKLKLSCTISLSLTFPRSLCSRAYPLHSKNNSSLGSSTPSLHTAMSFIISPTDQTIHPAIQLRPLRPLLTTFLPMTPSAVALDFHFLYPIQDLCH